MDILTTLSNIGYHNLTDCGQFWRSPALYRGGDNPTSLSIKKTTGEYYDFVEGKGGELQDLILRTLNLPTGTDIKTVIPNFSVPIFVEKEVELIETQKFDKIYLSKLIKNNQYWNSRGISNRVLEPLCGGIGPFPGRMYNRYVLPILDANNDIIGFAGRTINDSNPVKWKLLGKKMEWVFPKINFHQIINKKSVILVESIGDCLSLNEIGINNSLVLFGTSISNKIICFLLKNDIKKISILLNNDSLTSFTGNLSANKIENKLRLHFDINQINIITPPENDLNEMLVSDRDKFQDFCINKGII